MTNKRTTGQYIKAAHTMKGMTQLEVAEKVGIRPNTYSKIKLDEQEPSFASIRKIAKVLDLKLEEIPA